APKGFANRGQKVLHRSVQPLEPGSDDAIELARRPGHPEGGGVGKGGRGQQRDFEPAGAFLIPVLGRETCQKRDAKGRQQIELDRISEAPQERGGEEDAVKRKGTSESEEKRERASGGEQRRTAVPEVA